MVPFFSFSGFVAVHSEPEVGASLSGAEDHGGTGSSERTREEEGDLKGN